VTGDADVAVDQRGFDAVVRNLFQNAVVHGDARRVSVQIEALNTGAVIRLTFADDGRGVPGGAFDTLGQPFARAGSTGGSGIGLFVCRQLVTRMRGALRFVRPEPTRPGLTVVLELPGAR
jgi:signal transduction histidine kinase